MAGQSLSSAPEESFSTLMILWIHLYFPASQNVARLSHIIATGFKWHAGYLILPLLLTELQTVSFISNAGCSPKMKMMSKSRVFFNWHNLWRKIHIYQLQWNGLDVFISTLKGPQLYSDMIQVVGMNSQKQVFLLQTGVFCYLEV